MCVWKWMIEIGLVHSECLHYAIFKWNVMDSGCKHDSCDVCTCNRKCFSRLKIISPFSFVLSALCCSRHLHIIIILLWQHLSHLIIWSEFFVRSWFFMNARFICIKYRKWPTSIVHRQFGRLFRTRTRISSNMMDISCSKQFQTHFDQHNKRTQFANDRSFWNFSDAFADFHSTPNRILCIRSNNANLC